MGCDAPLAAVLVRVKPRHKTGRFINPQVPDPLGFESVSPFNARHVGARINTPGLSYRIAATNGVKGSSSESGLAMPARQTSMPRIEYRAEILGANP